MPSCVIRDIQFVFYTQIGHYEGPAITGSMIRASWPQSMASRSSHLDIQNGSLAILCTLSVTTKGQSIVHILQKIDQYCTTYAPLRTSTLIATRGTAPTTPATNVGKWFMTTKTHTVEHISLSKGNSSKRANCRAPETSFQLGEILMIVLIVKG